MRTDGRTDRRTEMRKLTVAPVILPKNICHSLTLNSSNIFEQDVNSVLVVAVDCIFISHREYCQIVFSVCYILLLTLVM